MASLSPTATFMNERADQIEELIGTSISHLLPQQDQIWEKLIVNSFGVQGADEMGRDYLIRKRYSVGLAGVVEGDAAQDDALMYGDKTITSIGERMYTEDVNSFIPDASLGTNPTPIKMAIPMRGIKANVQFSFAEMRADNLKANIGEIIAPKIRAHGKHIAQNLCLSWFLSQNNNYRISNITNVSAACAIVTGTSNQAFEVDLANYGDFTSFRLQTGNRVQIYSSDGTTLREFPSFGANSFLIVQSVDPWTQKVVLRAPDNSALDTYISTTLQDNDIIVLAGYKGTSTTPHTTAPNFANIAGWNSWIKTGLSGSTTLLGGEAVSGESINVNTHPEFKSFLVNNGGNPLTEYKMTRILDAYHQAGRMWGLELDTLIGSPGIVQSVLASRIGREQIDRTGRLASLNSLGLEGGNTEGTGSRYSITVNGRKYDLYESAFVEDGTIYGHKMGGNNWVVAVPPDIAGSTGDSRLGINAKFPYRLVAPMYGMSGALLPIQRVSNGSVVYAKGMQMPGIINCQVYPTKQVSGLKITNVATDRLLQATSES